MDLSPLPLLLDATEDLLPRPTPQLGVWSLYESYRRPRYGSLSPSSSLTDYGRALDSVPFTLLIPRSSISAFEIT